MLELAEKLELGAQGTTANFYSSPLQGLSLAKQHIQQLQNSLSPQWQQKKVVFPGGKLELVETLQLGPLHTFWFPQKQQAGLLDKELRVSYLFAGEQNQGLQTLLETGLGKITFDPVLGKALAIAQRQDTVLEHIQRGGVWVFAHSWRLLALPF